MSVGPLTTREAANLAGLPPDQFRSAMTKARRKGVEAEKPPGVRPGGGEVPSQAIGRG